MYSAVHSAMQSAVCSGLQYRGVADDWDEHLRTLAAEGVLEEGAEVEAGFGIAIVASPDGHVEDVYCCGYR
jgi:hypothetical protein